MSYDPHLCAWVTCPQCGKGFLSDVGPDYCSSRCETAYENEHKECENCGLEWDADKLNEQGICEDCEEESA